MRPRSSRPTAGRPVNQTQPLGKILAHLNITAAELSAATGIYSRTITEYLAGRVVPSPKHQTAISVWLDVPPDRLWPPHEKDPTT